MKHCPAIVCVLVGLWSLSASNISLAQMPDSLPSYYPLQVGNRWNYSFYNWSKGSIDTAIIRSDEITDTIIIGGKTFYRYVTRINTPSARPDTVRMDSIGRVWEYSDGEEYLVFDFTIADGDTYVYRTDQIAVVKYESWEASLIGVTNGIGFFFDWPYRTDSNREHIFVPHLGRVWESGAWIPAYVLQSAVIDGIVLADIGRPDPIPTESGLLQNYPNPFNATTTITYRLSNASNVSLAVYNLLGEEVDTLVDERQLPGSYGVVWSPNHAPSGVYYYRLVLGNTVVVNRMLLMK